MRVFQLRLIVCLITLNVPTTLVSPVEFLNRDPLYVALGRNLVLEAHFQTQPVEKIILRTWERKADNEEVRVADNDRTNNNRTSVEKNGLLLRIIGVTERDYGTYKVTFTDAKGTQMSAFCDVRKITNPPKASLSMQCSVLSTEAQWDRPVFQWQVNDQNVTNHTGLISEDGSTLFLTNLSQTYTCITDSSQGTSKVHVSIKAPTPGPGPEPSPGSPTCPCSCIGWIAFAVIEFILILVFIGICGYKMYKAKGESPI